MFEFRDLFQWDRFITPTIIKTFYWLVIALICLFGLSGIFSGLAAMAISPFGGFLVLLSSIASIVVGIVFSRIVAEFILIVFRINEHLGAPRVTGSRFQIRSWRRSPPRPHSPPWRARTPAWKSGCLPWRKLPRHCRRKARAWTSRGPTWRKHALPLACAPANAPGCPRATTPVRG